MAWPKGVPRKKLIGTEKPSMVITQIPVAPMPIPPVMAMGPGGRRCGLCEWYVAVFGGITPQGSCKEGPQTLPKRETDWCSRWKAKDRC